MAGEVGGEAVVAGQSGWAGCRRGVGRGGRRCGAVVGVVRGGAAGEGDVSVLPVFGAGDEREAGFGVQRAADRQAAAADSLDAQHVAVGQVRPAPPPRCTYPMQVIRSPTLARWPSAIVTAGLG
jgi:hypothetical protein